MFGVTDRDDEKQTYLNQRLRMVDQQLVRRGICDSAVLAAMRTVPRHRFIPENYRSAAYQDGPQPIGHQQTISQPYVVASMTEHLEIEKGDKVLEIGTGCGYQTAILAELTDQVYSVERIGGLLQVAETTLAKLGYQKVHTKLGDGTLGWAEEAPFDAIIVTAAAEDIPQPLVDQMAVKGRMVIPVESGWRRTQTLLKVVNAPGGLDKTALYEVRFVPLLGDTEG